MVIENTDIQSGVPVAVDKPNTIAQSFISNTKLLYEVDLYIGTYERINNSEIDITLRNSEDIIYQTEIDLSNMIDDNSWYKIIDDGIPLEIGKEYQIEMSYDGPMGNNIAVYVNNKQENMGDLLVNEEIQPNSLLVKVKGRDEP